MYRRKRLISWRDKQEDQLNLLMIQEQKMKEAKNMWYTTIKWEEKCSSSMMNHLVTMYFWRFTQNINGEKVNILINLRCELSIYSNIYFVQNTKNNKSMAQFLKGKKKQPNSQSTNYKYLNGFASQEYTG